MSSIKVFKGKLLPTIRKGFAEAPEINEKGKQIHDVVLDGNGNPITYTDTAGRNRTRRKVRKKRYREIDNLFNVYHYLADLQTYVNLRYEKALKSRKEGEGVVLDLGLTEELKNGLSFLNRRFKRKLSKESVSNFKRILTFMGEMETEIEIIEGPFADRDALFKNLKTIGRNAKFKKLMKGLEEVILNFFEIMGMSISTKQKLNPETKVNYLQFSLKKGIEKELEGIENEEEARLAELAAKMLSAQEKELENSLKREGYEVMSRAFFEGDSKEVVKIAYRKGIDSVVPVDKPAPFRADPNMTSDEIEAERRQYDRRPDVMAYNKYIKERESYVEGVYSASFLQQGTDPEALEYKVFGTVEEFKEEFRARALKEEALTNLYPEVEKDGNNYSIKYKQSWGVSYTLDRHDEPAFLEDEDRIVNLSDGKGNTKGLRRILSVRKALINGEPKNVITKGRYKGFLLEDMVNVQGRLVEGSYKIKIDGQSMEREMIQGGELKFLITEQSDPDKILDGRIKSRLLEPYITLSEDKTRLCIGIPSSTGSTADRKAMASLANEIATITSKLQVPIPFEDADPKTLTKEQKSLMTKARKANTANPFYYFRPEDYEIIRDTLGSVAMSKAASDFLDRYFDQLTKRDRALNAENLSNFTPEAIGGFVEEFNGRSFQINNKQREALAWMDANDYSGLMALDTGVGKTLFSVGAIRKAMAEEEGENRRFLFVSPSRLVGNLEKEINKFIKPDERGETLSRVDEMDYKRFSDLMKEEGTPYFKRTYFACFFDEVNEALKSSKIFKSVSGLLHPRKVLLTASAMEKDPVDLYKFVTLAQGVEYEKKGENAWAKRYCAQIGGRNIGLSPDPRVRQEFMRWVKANAFFAYKEEVDFDEINQPRLKPPTTQSVSVKMNASVQREYRKVAAEVSREIQAMLAKYRDADYDPTSYEYEEERVMRGRKKVVTKVIKDLAKVTLPKSVKTLMTLATDPEQILGDKAGRNPKLSACSDIIKGSPNSRIIFFTSDNKMALKTAISNTKARPAKVHCVLTATSIKFFQAKSKGGQKPILTVNKRTDTESAKFMEKSRSIRLGSEKDTEEDASWAIRVVQEYIAENDYIGTVVCTDAYARGFNFQRFQKVVHLDRGKDFDSELLKQRTARAYRTGQKETVDEIFLDSTIGAEGNLEGQDAESVTIQEIQKLLNESDQEFFQEIIQGGMKQSLTESLDAVEDITGEDLSRIKRPISGTYLERLLDPSPEAQARFEVKETLKDCNPLAYAMENKHDRYDVLFGTQGVLYTDIRDKKVLYSVLDEAGCALIASRFDRLSVRYGSTPGSFNIEGRIGSEQFTRRIESGTVMNTNMGERSPCSPEGSEIDALVSQISSLLKGGKASGISQSGLSGFEQILYGFNAICSPSLRERAYADEGMSYYLRRVKIDTSALDLHDLISAVSAQGKGIGVDWLRDNLDSGMKLSFNLASGSSSMTVANDFVKRKSAMLGIPAEDFLTRDMPSFDHSSLRCWMNFLKRTDMNSSEKKPYILKHEEDLKSALLSQGNSPLGAYVNRMLEGMEIDYSLFLDRPMGRTASERLSKEDENILRSIWEAIGNERLSNANKIELVEETDPSDLSAVLTLKERS